MSNQVLITSKTLETVQTTQYTALSNAITFIDKFTVTNVGTGDSTASVHLVNAGDSADSTNLIVDAVVISENKTYRFPELIGHQLNPSQFISTIGTGNSVIRSTGREIS